jgi:hypothetical protein
MAARAYPGWIWTPSPTWLPEDPPVPQDEMTELAAALESVLPTRSLRLGRDGTWGEGIYLLGGIHAPCWLELREGVLESAVRTHECGAETYLRVLFSPVGRYYTLQEVRSLAVRDSTGVWVEEKRLAGVEDRRLQLFVKATQGLLRKHRLIGLDAVFLSEPVPDPVHEATRLLGAPPTLWTLLFESSPPVTTRGEYLL